MIIDFRYHIASLVAVFLALGTGILIGGAVLGNSALQKELGQIEQNLGKMRSDQRVLETEIAKRDADLRTYNQFGRTIMPALIRNKLLGKRIALIRTNPHTDQRLAKDVVRILATAGASVISTTTVLRNPQDLTADVLAVIADRLGVTAPDTPALCRQIMELLADRVANGPPSGLSGDDILPVLVNGRLIETSGDYREMVDILVLFGGSQEADFDTSKGIDRILIDTAVGAKGLLVAAVEPSDVARSYLAEYLQHPIVVVDNIEMVAGQTALVLALVRGKKAHYGVKGAHQLLPEVP